MDFAKMLRSCVAGWVFVLSLFVQGSAQNGDPLPSVRTTMRSIYGEQGVGNAIAEGLRPDLPDWANLAEKSKDLLPLAENLKLASPPHGNKEDWKKKTEAYFKAASDLNLAIQKHDKAAALAAQFGMSNCKACHQAHRQMAP